MTITKCKYIDNCPLYQHFTVQAVKQAFIMIYCEGDPESCERRKLRDAGRPVPERMLPNGSFLTLTGTDENQ